MMKHQIEVQLRFSDFDMMRHVNNARYASYMELGRIAFFNEVIDRQHNWQHIGMVVARLELDFKLPVLWGEQMMVETRVTEIGQKSMQIENLIFAGKESASYTIRAVGRTVLVCFHYTENKSILVPTEWRTRVENYLVS